MGIWLDEFKRRAERLFGRYSWMATEKSRVDTWKIWLDEYQRSAGRMHGKYGWMNTREDQGRCMVVIATQ
jgi:hypothetical protein